MKDQSVSFKNVWPQLNDEIIEKMATFGQCGKIKQCIDLFEQMLINISYHQSRKLNHTVHKGVSLINQTHGKYRINHLADCLGVSGRHLRNLFHTEVGLNPQRLAKIVRVTEVVKRIDGGVTDNWATNAHQADYYDQSHLIDDFNLLLGQSQLLVENGVNYPEIYMERVRVFYKYFPLLEKHLMTYTHRNTTLTEATRGFITDFYE